MDIEEAVRHLDVSTKTLRRWVSQGKLQARRIPGATHPRLDFSPEDLDALQRELVHPEVILDNVDEAGQPPSTDDQFVQVPANLDKLGQPPQEDSLPVQVSSLSPIALNILEEIAKALQANLDKSGHQPGQTGKLPRQGFALLLSVEEAASYLGVSPAKIRELLREGKLRGIRGMGRGWRIKREDLKKFVEEL